jgi:hypothetical protein
VDIVDAIQTLTPHFNQVFHHSLELVDLSRVPDEDLLPSIIDIGSVMSEF